MPICELATDEIRALKKSTFEEAQLQERRGLQRPVIARPGRRPVSRRLATWMRVARGLDTALPVGRLVAPRLTGVSVVRNWGVAMGALAGLFAAVLVAVGMSGSGSVGAEPDDSGPRRPIIIAHRGASGALPEHTIAAFETAIAMGADFIEPDLVMTRDGVLVVRHDRYLSTSTDVENHPEFATRRRTQMTPAGPRTDWWAEDFTLAELRTLRARQPFAGRDQRFDGVHAIPTFREVLDLVVRHARNGRIVGIYPETKAPGHHASIGLPMAQPLLDDLAEAGIAELGIPVFIQSFEQPILEELKAGTDHPLIQLVAGSPAARLAGIEPPVEAIDVAGVGANKAMLFNADGTPSDFMARARAKGLLVHVWTVRDDDVPERYGSVEDELRELIALGVDGVFTDFPDTALAVRDAAQP